MQGDGPTARYDIEIVSVEEGTERSAADSVITALGGRRAAFRLLFAASFVPYFLPEQFQPDFFKDEKPQSAFTSEVPPLDRRMRPPARLARAARRLLSVSLSLPPSLFLFLSEALPDIKCWQAEAGDAGKPKVDLADRYVSKSLDSLFANEQLPKAK